MLRHFMHYINAMRYNQYNQPQHIIIFFYLGNKVCSWMRTRKVYTVHLLASARPTLLPGQTRKPTLRLRSLRYPLAMHFLLVAQFLHSLLFTWFTTAHKSLIYALIIIIPIRLKYGWIFQFFPPSSKPMVQILYTSTPLLITHFHICTYFSENFHLRIGSQFWLEFPIKIYIIHTSTKLLDENERERESENEHCFCRDNQNFVWFLCGTYESCSVAFSPFLMMPLYDQFRKL